jgi:hypothetical protein
MAVKIQVEVLWVVTPCSAVVGIEMIMIHQMNSAIIATALINTGILSGFVLIVVGMEVSASEFLYLRLSCRADNAHAHAPSFRLPIPLHWPHRVLQ